MSRRPTSVAAPGLEAALSAWFAAHGGLISRAEAERLGLTPGQISRRVTSGVWVRLYPGVFRLAGVPQTPLTRLRGALLVGGSDAVASHHAAAWVYGLCDDPPAEPVITVPRARIVRVPGLRAVRSSHPFHTVVRRGVPCTDPTRTILDCASETTADRLDALVDQAVARKVIGVATLTRATAAAPAPAHHYHPGRALLAQRLAARGVAGSPNPSVLESRTARLMHRHRIPTPKAEVTWGPGGRYRLDFAYPGLRLVIEVDGRVAHLTPEKQRHDNRRGNALNRAGWTVLHYDWWEITTDADRVAREIADTYRDLAAA
jgi:very-short-patch-repair endonuclease